jgi:hypothetical protein
MVYDDPYLTSLVINHHSTKSINQLLSIGTKEPNNCSYQGRRLLTIWLDFGAETQLMEQALGGAVSEFPLSVPEDVLEPTGETSSTTAAATATTSSGGGGKGSDPTLETGSSTLIIASDEPSTSASRLPVLPPTHQPVSVTPIAPGTIQFSFTCRIHLLENWTEAVDNYRACSEEAYLKEGYPDWSGSRPNWINSTPRCFSDCIAARAKPSEASSAHQLTAWIANEERRILNDWSIAYPSSRRREDACELASRSARHGSADANPTFTQITVPLF